MPETTNAALKGPVHRAISEGDNREPLLCQDCGFIHYQNPKVVVGAVVTWQEQFLLCRRAIEPRRGFWTMPAGYLELNEAATAGAMREAWEEARAHRHRRAARDLRRAAPRARFSSSIAPISTRPNSRPGRKSLEVKLCRWDDIPWSELAFPSVHWGLKHHRESMTTGDFTARNQTF